MADFSSAFSTGLDLGRQGLARLFGPLAASSLASTESGPVTLSQDPVSMLWSPRIVGGNSADGFLVESGPGNLVTARAGDPGYDGLLAQMQVGG